MPITNCLLSVLYTPETPPDQNLFKNLYKNASSPEDSSQQQEAPNVIVNKQPTPPREQGEAVATAAATAAAAATAPTQLQAHYALEK